MVCIEFNSVVFVFVYICMQTRCQILVICESIQYVICYLTTEWDGFIASLGSVNVYSTEQPVDVSVCWYWSSSSSQMFWTWSLSRPWYWCLQTVCVTTGWDYETLATSSPAARRLQAVNVQQSMSFLSGRRISRRSSSTDNELESVSWPVAHCVKTLEKGKKKKNNRINWLRTWWWHNPTSEDLICSKTTNYSTYKV